MSKRLGALVFVAGVAGLTYWGTKVQAVSMEKEIAAASDAVVAKYVLPLDVRVSGRDITVTGVADTAENLAAITEELDGLRGRRVVNVEGITVLPRVEPYETALAKGAGGDLEAMGYAPTEAARAALVEAGFPAGGLALATGAPEGWAEALSAGATALAPLDEGSFTLTGDTLTLSGVAATPVEEQAARAALDVPGEFESVVALDVADPGIVDFSLSGSPDEGFTLDGVVPEALGVDGIAAALGREVTPGKVTTTFADAPGLEAALAGFGQLDGGSFKLADRKLTLTGLAATPAEEQAARAALEGLGDVDADLSLDVADPGIVDFALDYAADTGFSLDGTVPESFGAEAFTAALGRDVSVGELDTTYADLPGLEPTLSGLGTVLGEVETLEITGSNDGLAAKAQALAGLDVDTVARTLGAAFGSEVAVDVTAPAESPEDGTERVNAGTGVRQFAFGGGWVTLPQGLDEPTADVCATTAMERVQAAPIRFVTGSAELDPASVATIDDLAGIVNLCTRAPGMVVTIGGHTDATGDPEQNYVLSAQRARAVKNALAARGVPPGKMIAIGYGETEPVADNETEEGRALNRRTTFAWPN